jgi:peptidoglycan/xylan/chitin deacetylase (PgdA/CDA1 family)
LTNHKYILATAHAWSPVNTLVCSSTFSLGAAAAVVAYGVGAPSSQFFGSSVFHGDRSRRSLALTFDEVPRRAPPDSSTFFQCGANVVRHPDIARDCSCRPRDWQSYVLSLASMSTPRLETQSPVPRGHLPEFATAQQVIEETTGVRPRHLCAPYGLRWFDHREPVSSACMTAATFARTPT